MNVIRHFWGSLLVTVLVLGGSFAIGGMEVLLIVAILSILEVSLSFDNAVVNATVLKRMSLGWQRLFLTVGILIAVFGMRLILPLLIVAVTAGLSPSDAFNLALNDPDLYAAELAEAHPSIAAFGGMFLGMIFLDFMLEEREHRWISVVERPSARLGGINGFSVLIALILLLVSTLTFAGDHAEEVLVAGVAGLIAYLAVNGLAGFFEGSADPDDDELAGVSGPASRANGAVAATGKAAFFLFLYLELLDASFSFDGVIGAFAITSNIFVIAAGLGVGAMYVRSMTVVLVRRGTLEEYVYLEHGAHYAIGALAVLLLVTIKYEVPELVTGLIGVGFIALAFWSSLRRNRRVGHEEPVETNEGVSA